MRYALFPALLLVFISGAIAGPEFDLAFVSDLFPNQGLESRVAFWKSVYSEYGQRDVILHDRTNLAIIYKVLKFDSLPSDSVREARAQRKTVEEEISKIRGALHDFAGHGIQAAGTSPVHSQVYEALQRAGASMNSDFVLAAAARVRDQRGIRERFEQGVVRSGLYLSHMKEIFRDRGLPEELAYLPHVESSFEYAAYSKVGAAGIWQFMRSTARGLLKMNSVMDERRDPLRATEAAATVLSRNYTLLENWPLAITAYNHGTNGMLRAKAQYGPDYLSILNCFDGRAFGFASQNFYAEFLAALELAKNSPEYFPQVKAAEPLRFERLVMNHAGARDPQLALIRDLSPATLRAYNPGIMVDIRRNFSRLPAGYVLRLPEGEPQHVLAALSPAEQRWITRGAPPAPRPPRSKAKARQYKVQRGDTLTKIASLFRVSTAALKEKNKSLRSGQIFAGQIIVLP
ncbi:MAG: transglycosylase SLT domain-containing protein [Acidobacteria bacterium]|nr:transglycosylase SLT domain-containing protein [Acidobacteriota bacterium]